MRPVVYSTEGPWGNLWPWFVKATGCEHYPASGGLRPGVGIMWGILRGIPALITASIVANRPWVYLDHGYFNRGHYSGHYRMTWCDFQQRGVIERPADRWEALGVTLEPWKRGRNVVVCPPSDLILKLYGIPDWTRETVAAIKQKTDRPVVIQTKGQPFDEALRDAHCVVTVSSVAAVEAVSKGVPVFVSEISAAAPVGRVDLEIESPVYPEREPWARSLAYGQFTKEEWGRGWEVVNRS